VDQDDLEPAELDLRDYLRVLRRRKLTILVTVVLVVGATLAFTLLQTPVYQATSKILVRSAVSTGAIGSDTEDGLGENAVANEIEILDGQAVRDAAEEELGDVPDASFSRVEETDVVEIKVRNTNARTARDQVNVYADVYLEVRQAQIADELLNTRQRIQLQIDELNARLGALDAAVLGLPPEAQGAALESQAGERASISQQLAFYSEELDRLALTADLAAQAGAQVLSEASVPDSPVSPKPVRNGLLALVAGLVLGLGLAFLREYLDDSVKTKDDLERASEGIAMIGLIPAVAGWKDRKTPYLVTAQQPRSPAAEAYRTLRTSLQFLSLERPVRSLQVTSATAAEGKTTTLANLAVTFARAGQRVTVVDLDLRRPRIHAFFGLEDDVGFTSVLLGEVPVSEAVLAVPDEPGLTIIPSGPPPPNPAELLSQRRVIEVIEALEARCDLVLVDSPPVVPVTDPLMIAGFVDATLLVADAGSSRKKGVHRAFELLRQVNAPIVGSVLNEVDLSRGYMADYGSGTGYRGAYYQATEPAKPAAKNGAKRRRKERMATEASSDSAPRA
jgi:succinoglycan biosynthesis transport protein ExoP